MNEPKPIGVIKSQFKSKADPFEMKKQKSTIIINPELEEGLYDIESCTYIDVIFQFHESTDYSLRLNNYFNEDKGVFASRSPRRPNNIGLTTVKLMERKGNELIVSGLDAIDNTPVLDIKPMMSHLVDTEIDEMVNLELKSNPRRDILKMIKTNDMEGLLLKAGALHGHFCPGLALGVKAATFLMQKMTEMSDGMEDLIVIAETNNCASDGIQFVTGCTLGNNALIFKDFGKTAFTLATRDGNGIRVITKPDSQQYMRSKTPSFYEQFRKVVIEQNHDPEEKKLLRKAGIEASFSVLDMNFDNIYNIEDVTVEIPQYAPIYDSILCDQCGESTMATRIVETANKRLCLSCSDQNYGYLDGHGIKCF